MPETVPYKVLFVDDDEFLLSMYSLKSKKDGLDAEVAAGSMKALERLRALLVLGRVKNYFLQLNRVSQ